MESETALLVVQFLFDALWKMCAFDGYEKKCTLCNLESKHCGEVNLLIMTQLECELCLLEELVANNTQSNPRIPNS